MDLTEFIPGWLPPSRSNWELVVLIFKYFPLMTATQWLFPWYPAGKTSTESRWNLPGKFAWIVMEAPAFIIMLYMMFTSPIGYRELPLMNWTMAGMFTVHYIYRAVIGPLLNPSMSPIHIVVALAAIAFHCFNAVGIGGWLAGYGPTRPGQWGGNENAVRVELGMVVWALGFMGNIFHDDELREIRRSSIKASPGSKGTKVYQIPRNGLFRVILYPHYLCEWVEWAGFWMIGGVGCVPARSFLINEMATMIPRALQGRRWYVARFGEDKVQNRKAVIPWLL